MNNYSIRIEVEDGKVEEILDRLSKAQKEIYKCYTELENLGVLTLRETATPKRVMAARTSISTVGDDFGKFSNLGDQFFDIPNRGRGR